MKVKNNKSGSIYKITGSYYSACDNAVTMYICPEESSNNIIISLAELMTEYEPVDKNTVSADVTDFGVIAISKLAKVEIADRDYTEGDKKHFDFDEACEIEKKLNNGWRLPTRSEWVLICEEFGQEYGVLDIETLIDRLKLGRGGFLFNGALDDVGEGGYYWSSTPCTNVRNACCLTLWSGINPSNFYNRLRGFSVRLVRDVKGARKES